MLKPVKDLLKPGFMYRFQHRRNGVLLADVTVHNIVPAEGLNYLIDTFFIGSIDWYCGIIVNNGTLNFNNADTAGKITTEAPNFPTTNAWQEEVNISGGNRLLLAFGTISGSGNAIATPVVFTMTGSGLLGGGFIATSEPIGSTLGRLYSEVSQVSPVINYEPGDTITATVEMQFLPVVG